MANPANQLHMVTESAQHAQTVSGSTADSLHGHVTRLNGEVGAVIGSGWSMDQAIAFANAHEGWAKGMANLVVALNKVSADTGAHLNDYVHNDETQASALNTVQAPMFSGVL
jgi:uncharacterized protein YukE